MEITGDVVAAAAGASADRESRVYWFFPEDETQEQDGNQEKSKRRATSLPIDIEGLLDKHGSVKISGSIVLEGMGKRFGRKLQLISPDTAFQFHRLNEMQLKVRHSNENHPSHNVLEIANAIESYLHHQANVNRMRKDDDKATT